MGEGSWGVQLMRVGDEENWNAVDVIGEGVGGRGCC